MYSTIEFIATSMIAEATTIMALVMDSHELGIWFSGITHL